VPQFSIGNRLESVRGLSVPRSIVIIALIACAAGLSGGAFARNRTIGFLSFASADHPQPCLHALKRGLRTYGLTEGDNLTILVRHADGDEALLPPRARELVRLGPEVLVSRSLPPLLALRAATTETPIVSLGSGGLVNFGLIKSLSQPGTNVTGYSMGHSEHAIKPLDMLAQALPNANRIGVVLNANNPSHRNAQRIVDPLSVGRRFRIITTHFRSPSDIAGAWDSLVAERVHGVIVWPDAPLFIDAHAAQAVRVRLPAISLHRRFAEAGGLMAYGIEGNTCSEGARYIAEILAGKKPRDLPVEELNEARLVLNLAAAQSLGIEFPASMIARATELLEK
jgi:putative ABC transport system substrate-binding protein